MSFEFSVNKSAGEKVEQLPTESEQAFQDAINRFKIDYEKEWPLVQSALGEVAITNRNRDFAIDRLSTLLAGLKTNPDKQLAEDRIAAAIVDIKRYGTSDGEDLKTAA